MYKKFKLLASAVVFLSFVGVQAQTPHYYYYKGQKIYLNVSKTHLYIIADDEFMQSSDAKSLFQKTRLERDTATVLKFRFQSEPTLSEYEATVDSLRQNPQIKKVLPYFERGNAEPIGTSHIFYIKLKNIEDTTLLRTIAERHNVEIVKRSPYMPLWFVLYQKNCTFAKSFNNKLKLYLL